MTNEVKTILAITAAFIVLIGTGLYFYEKNNVTGPVDQSVLVHSDSHEITATSSTVTVVEFGDYQCPACDAAYPIVNEALAKFKGKINFVFRNFPLPMHQYAQIAAEAAEAAGEQGQYWQMHDDLYENQQIWVATSTPENYFIQYATQLGLNVDQFKNAIDSNKFQPVIDQDVKDGTAAGVDGTPTFFVNGQALLLSTNDDLDNAIAAALGK